MSATNKTPNYDLPQWVGSDHPTWQGDLNNAMLTIDNALESHQSAIEALSGTEEFPSVEYYTITCDMWDYGMIAAKPAEQTETPLRRNMRRY